MLCEKCQSREATVFLTQIINGQMQKADLCEKCAREAGVTQTGAVSLTNLLLKGTGIDCQSEEGPSCPACGFTRQNLGKTGRLGCPVCYDTFGKTIEEAVGGMQRGPRHIGKVPRRLMGEITAARERGQVEKALGEAIRAEQYEEAARLRDRLRSLNNSV